MEKNYNKWKFVTKSSLAIASLLCTVSLLQERSVKAAENSEGQSSDSELFLSVMSNAERAVNQEHIVGGSSEVEKIVENEAGEKRSEKLSPDGQDEEQDETIETEETTNLGHYTLDVVDENGQAFEDSTLNVYTHPSWEMWGKESHRLEIRQGKVDFSVIQDKDSPYVVETANLTHGITNLKKSEGYDVIKFREGKVFTSDLDGDEVQLGQLQIKTVEPKPLDDYQAYVLDERGERLGEEIEFTITEVPLWEDEEPKAETIVTSHGLLDLSDLDESNEVYKIRPHHPQFFISNLPVNAQGELEVMLFNGKLTAKSVDNKPITVERILLKKRSDIDESQHIKYKTRPIPVAGEGLNELDFEDISFKLFDSTSQEVVGEFQVNGQGELPSLELFGDHSYFLQIKSNNYKMANVYWTAFRENDFPYNFKERFLQNKLVVTKKPAPREEDGRYRIELSLVGEDSQPISGKKITFIADGDQFSATSDSLGKLHVSLLEDLTYTLDAEDEEFFIDTFPLVLKDKTEWGEIGRKYTFDHSSCHMVQQIVLKKKTSEKVTGSVTCKPGNTTIKGMDFKDLVLESIHLEANHYPELKGKDVAVFDFVLWNTLRERKERSKITTGDFEIIRKLPKDKIVADVYYLHDGVKEKLTFRQKDNLVKITDVHSLSIDPLIIEYQSNELVFPEDPETGLEDDDSTGESHVAPITFIIKDQATNGVYMEPLTFKIKDIKTGEELAASSSNSMLTFELKKNASYKIGLDESSNKMMDEITFEVDQDGLPKTLGHKILAELVIKDKNETTTEPLQYIMLSYNNLPVMENIAFTLTDLVSKKEYPIVSHQGMLSGIELVNGRSYLLKINENKWHYEMAPVTFTFQQGAGFVEGKLLDQITLLRTEDENQDSSAEEKKFDRLIVKVRFDKKPLENQDLRLFKFDEFGIPTVISQPKTDARGEVVLEKLDKNAEYQIRLGSSDKNQVFNTDSFSFKTDHEGYIKEIDEEHVQTIGQDLSVTFEGHNKEQTKEGTYLIEFRVVDDAGKPVEGVTFTANRISPKLSSYKDSTSDKNGLLQFELEGSKNGMQYSICIAKNAQFLWQTDPHEITVEVDSKGDIVFTGDKKQFVVRKNDRRYIRENLSEAYRTAKEYLKNTSFTTEAQAEQALNKLKKIMAAAQKDVEGETIPEYASSYTDQLVLAMLALKPFEKNQDEDQKQVIHIPDPRFKRMLNAWLNPGGDPFADITVEQMATLTELNDVDREGKVILPQTSLAGTEEFKFATTRGLKSIEGLQYAKNLKKLKVTHCEIKDLSPIKALLQLEELDLSRNRLTDIEVIARLTNLTYLKLYNNWITDITPLKNLRKLTYLDLHYNGYVTGSETNKIRGKGLEDITVIQNLKNLVTLDLSSNRIKSIEPLKNLKKLRTLSINDCEIADLSPMMGTLIGLYYRQLTDGSTSAQFFGQQVEAGTSYHLENGTLTIQNPFQGMDQFDQAMSVLFDTDIDTNQIIGFRVAGKDIPLKDVNINRDTHQITLTFAEDSLPALGKEIVGDLLVGQPGLGGHVIKNIRVRYEEDEDLLPPIDEGDHLGEEGDKPNPPKDEEEPEVGNSDEEDNLSQPEEEKDDPGTSPGDGEAPESGNADGESTSENPEEGKDDSESSPEDGENPESGNADGESTSEESEEGEDDSESSPGDGEDPESGNADGKPTPENPEEGKGDSESSPGDGEDPESGNVDGEPTPENPEEGKDDPEASPGNGEVPESENADGESTPEEPEEGKGDSETSPGDGEDQEFENADGESTPEKPEEGKDDSESSPEDDKGNSSANSSDHKGTDDSGSSQDNFSPSLDHSEESSEVQSNESNLSTHTEKPEAENSKEPVNTHGNQVEETDKTPERKESKEGKQQLPNNDIPRLPQTGLCESLTLGLGSLLCLAGFALKDFKKKER